VHKEEIKEKAKKYRIEHPEKYNSSEYQKNYRDNHKEQSQKYHTEWHLKKKYNLSLTQYNKMLEEQNGVCAICGNKETVKDKRTNVIRKLSVDHNHTTGKIRDLLCDSCNNLLGQIKENINICYLLIDYLNKHKDY
jgi:hypothetical protein